MADVKNSAFLLGEATLLMTPYSDTTPVFELTPELHSLGMVRNVTLNSESDQVELRKGIMQLLVDSKKSNVRVSLSTEVFEFSAQNVYRSLSLAKTATSTKRGKLKTTVTGPQATIVINSDPLPGEANSAITVAGDVPVGSTVLIQVAGIGNDYVLPVRVTATTTVATGDITITAAVPTGMTFPAGSRVWVVNEIDVGSVQEQDFFKVKVVGTLSNNERPLAIVFPKVKVSKGFQLQFDEGNYTSMPFEFSPYFLSGAEISGRLAEIGTTALAKAYLA